MQEKMGRNGPKPNRTGNSIEYFISLDHTRSRDISTSGLMLCVIYYSSLSAFKNTQRNVLLYNNETNDGERRVR